MGENRKTITGAALIVLQAIALGLAANAISPHGIPLIRKPLSETHRLASHAEALRNEAVTEAVVNAKAAADQPIGATKIEPASPLAVERAVGPQVAAKPKTTPSGTGAMAPTIPNKPAQAQPVLNRPPIPAPGSSHKKIEALFTTLADAQTLWKDHGAVFVDARNKQDYNVEHIAGAISLDLEEIDRLYSSVMRGIAKDRKIVTYCSDPQCEAAIKLADALVARGHTQVLILLEGLPGWKDAGNETTKGASP